MKTRKQIKDEMEAKSAELTRLLAVPDDDQTAESAQQIESLTGEVKGLKAELAQFRDLAAAREEVKGLGREVNAPISRAAANRDDRDGREEAEAAIKSLGDAVASSDEVKSWRPGVQGQRVVVEVPVWPSDLKATVTTTGLTGYQRVPGIVELEQQRLTVADLLGSAQTSMPTIRYWRENTFANAATTVAEGGLKPEASFDIVETDAPVRKIAVVSKMSDEFVSDYPTLQSYINSRLIFMVGTTEEAQLLNGAGTGTTITGILNTSGIQTQAVGTISATNTVLDNIMKAITKVRSTGFFEPDGLVIHPTDYQILRLAKDGQNQYYGGGPFYAPYGNGMVAMQPSPWGLRTVVTTAIAAGTALVGAFALGATVFRRQGITVDIANQNENDFLYNRVAVRVEERLALAVWRPLAFCKVTGIA